MKRALIFALLVCLPASAAVTFTAKLQTINGAPSNQFLHLELKGCARYFTTNGTAVITKALDLYPDAQGNISASVQDSQLLTCGTVTGAAYYGISTCQAGKKCPAEAIYTADYDITGATFNLNSASPKSGTPPTVFNGNATQLQGRNVSPSQPDNGDVWVWNAVGLKWEPQSPGEASVPDATTTSKGKVALAGELGGTADLPVVRLDSGYSVNIPSPVTADSGTFQHKLGRAYTVLSVSCSTDQGTASINFDIRSEDLPNTPGTQLLPVPLVCNSTTASTSTIASPNVGAGLPAAVLITATSGTPGVVRIHVSTKYQ
jgi:hypothetical protein